LDIIPDDIMEHYDVLSKADGNSVVVEIMKGMYDLSSAGRLASDWLRPHLEKYGYTECQHTHGLFKHKDRPIMFTLVVDDFGVQYVGKENADHLFECITAKYKCTRDDTGSIFCGIQLDCRKSKTTDLSEKKLEKIKMWSITGRPATKTV